MVHEQSDMLVRASISRVVVRSGHLMHPVCFEERGSGLYVFSEQAICASLVHQCPSVQGEQAVAPDALAK